MPPPGDLLRCTGLRRTFGERVAVDDVSFTIAEGETYGLLGPNGAGKTTLISMVCGLLRPDAGTVAVAGEPVDDRHPATRSAIGYVPQDLALYPDLSGRENLHLFGRLQGLGRAELRRRAEEVLELTGLADRADERIETYSGGMKRRANIAAGLLHHPRLLVLDEPTVGVDPQSRNAILESIDHLGGEGLAVLYTTHYMEEAERLCDRIGILDEGRLVTEGSRSALIAAVGEQATIRLAGTGSLVELARRAGGIAGVSGASTGDGAVELVVDDPHATLAPVIDLALDVGVAVSAVDVAEPDLEAVFLHLTGKALRD